MNGSAAAEEIITHPLTPPAESPSDPYHHQPITHIFATILNDTIKG